ncbi:hypothetical protein JXA80_14445 [bacterium]|nr:hypothetical protein [candidate division CSSED10-310 bacterium]
MEPSDFSQIKRQPIARRTNLVQVSEFARIPPAGSGFREFLDIFPQIKHRTNAATSLATVIERILAARLKGHSITWALGPHVVKYGLTPLIIELMNHGIINHVLTNGAGAIHDVEIAMIGETSEEMGGHISTGEFGMAEETGLFINGCARTAMETNQGFGEILGRRILDDALPHAGVSLFAQAVQRGIPITVHVAIGTDIIHMHPDMDGCATGQASFTDFRRFVTTLRRFKNGGVHLNIGSTVVLPEVFVKALTAANNLNGVPAGGFTTVNIDHLSEYRPLMNVVRRGSMDGGEGYEIIGRMEILVPLLVRILLAELRNEPR